MKGMRNENGNPGTLENLLTLRRLRYSGHSLTQTLSKSCAGLLRGSVTRSAKGHTLQQFRPTCCKPPRYLLGRHGADVVDEMGHRAPPLGCKSTSPE